MHLASPVAIMVPVTLANPRKVFIFHAVAFMRLGIAAVLHASPEFESAEILNFPDVGAAEEALRSAGAGDIVISDVTAWVILEPKTTKLREAGVAFALVTGADEVAARLWAKRGVTGMIAPDATAQELIDTASALAEGHTSFHLTGGACNNGFGRLSHRQFEILELMTRGLLNKQIAWQLGLTEGTVKSHVSAILEKLGCDRRTQAIAAFLQSFSTRNAPSMIA